MKKKALKQLSLQTYVILHKIYMSYTKYLFRKIHKIS